MYICEYICIHMNTYWGQKPSPGPKLAARPAGRPAVSNLHKGRPAGPAGRAAARPPDLGQGLALGPNMYAYVYIYICMCIYIHVYIYIYICICGGLTPTWVPMTSIPRMTHVGHPWTKLFSRGVFVEIFDPSEARYQTGAPSLGRPLH